MNVMLNKDLLVLHVASYLYAIRYKDSTETQTPQQCMDSFVTMYLEEQEHSPGCRGICWACYVQTHLDKAKSMLVLDKFDEYKEKYI
jgi:hypothetical protein